MKDSIYTKVGKFLMKHGDLRICIVDDQKTYFSDNMIQVANSAGFRNIERHFIVDKQLMKALLENPPDIIILDIKELQKKKFPRTVLELQSCYMIIQVLLLLLHQHIGFSFMKLIKAMTI